MTPAGATPEEAAPTGPTGPAAPRRRGRPWIGMTLLSLVALLLVGLWGAIRWLDTDAGHRFVARQIAGWQPGSGLRVTIGSIDGQLFKAVTLRDVRLSDPKGQFARIAQADLDWYPLGWFSNRLDIDRLHVRTAELARLPKLNPGRQGGSILPGFDIRLAELRVDRLALGAAVAGRPHMLNMSGRADVRSRRAMINLRGVGLDSGDAVRLVLDSRPDDGVFDIDALAYGPAGGVITGFAKLDQPLALSIRGDGNAHDWRGRLIAVQGRQLVTNLALRARDGRYTAEGPLALVGPLAALGKGQALVSADLGLEDRIVSGKAAVALPAVRLEANGGVDLGRNRFDNLRLQALVAQPGRLAAGVQGRPVALNARLSGPFNDVSLGYLLTAPDIRQGTTRLTDLRMEGEARLSAGSGAVPFRLTARALALGEPQVDNRLRNLVAEGRIVREGDRFTLAPTAIRASGFAGQLDGEGTADGAFAANLRGGFDGLDLRGFGRLDLSTLLRLSRPAKGATSLGGSVRAVMRRLDIGFLQSLAEGLPVATSDVALGAGGRIDLRNLRLVAPGLRLAGHGYRERNGRVHIEGSGEHRAYGPVRLTLAGDIARPQVDLLLARPLPALGLTNVRAQLMPDAQGYAVHAEGGSMLGAFKGEGAILLPAHGDATISIASLGVSNVVLKGDLVPVGGGLQGTLALSGPAQGSIDLSMVDGVQKIGANVNLAAARFEGSPAIIVNRGTLTADILLKPGAISVKGNAQGRGMRVGSLAIGRFAAAIDLTNGEGTATLSANARNGQLFDLQSRAAIAVGRVLVDLQGSINRRAVRLDRTARLTREEEGWRLAPATLRMQGGALRVGGLFGSTATHLEAQAQTLPLALLDMVNSELGLGGTADGRLTYDQPRGGIPSGRMDLRIHDLTRSGLALSSAPIDMGVNAVLDGQRLAARGLVARGGTVIGRLQALVTPLSGDTLTDRLFYSPLRAQLRYAGAADTLWRLSAVEIVSLGGQVQLSADATGTLADPQIRGTLTARDATLESPVTGMSLTGVSASGTFSGARLTLDDLSGKTAGNGQVTGTATFDFSAERGIGMDIQLQAQRAVLLDRDDVGATVTGPLRLQSTGNGGVISGDLDVVASRFMLGKASTVAEIPQIRLVELNRAGEEVERSRAAAPWRLDVRARARRGLKVEGLGMRSEWSADLTIGGTVTAPAFRGTATLIDGTYDFAGKRFDLQEGRLTFNGSSPVNPTLDIRAVADVEDLSATITVTGTSLRPEIAFSSIPAMSQDELLSRLLFGTSISNLSAPEAVQLASAVAAFQGEGGGLDPINAIRRATGLSRLRVLPADSTTGAGTSIAAGKNIGRHLYVELITDGQGYSATRVEYQITRWLSLLSSVSTIGRQSVSARISKDY